MLLTERYTRQVLSIGAALLCACACSAQTTAMRATDAWVTRLATGYFDARQEADQSIARMGDTPGTVHLLNSLRAALDSARNARIGTMDRMTFLTRYRPVWKADKVLTAEWDRRASRIASLSEDVIKSWTSALQAAHGDDIAELWIIGFVIDADALFSGSTFNSSRSANMLARLKTLPTASIDTVAKALHTGRGWAAVLLIQNDDLFDPSGTTRPQQLESALKLLSDRLTAAK